MLNTYTFDVPVAMEVDGINTLPCKKIEFFMEAEEFKYDSTVIKSAFNKGKWTFSLTNGKDYAWPSSGIIVSFFNKQGLDGPYMKILVTTSNGCHPFVTDTIEHKIIQGATNSYSFVNPATTMHHNVAGYGRRHEVDKLPGIKEDVKHPVTGRIATLETTIISLNDDHEWTREQIADWLETLDVDIRFHLEETKE